MKTNEDCAEGTTKIVRQYVYEGLGFPIILRNIKVFKSRGLWVPDVDYNELQAEVAKNIATHLHCITGNQLRFLRLHLGYNAYGLAMKMGVHPSQICRWEKAKENEIVMSMKSRSKLMKYFRAKILKIHTKTGYEYDDTILVNED